VGPQRFSISIYTLHFEGIRPGFPLTVVSENQA
jgi:hypothetical protein